MVNGEALQLALVLHAQPARSAEFRSRALPAGVTEVLRIASGNAGSLANAAEQCGVSPDALVEAARFFVEQQLLARECEHDPWRVLGVSSTAEPDLIRDHRRLLMGLVHPDRGQDWAAAFSDRVNRAWRELKTPEGRLAASRQSSEPARDASWSSGQGDSPSSDSTEGRSRAPRVGDPDDAWAPSNGDVARTAENAGDADWPVSTIPTGARGNPPPRNASRAATLGGAALLLSAVAVLGWNLMETEGLGYEVLVPMADVARPAVATSRSLARAESAMPPASTELMDQALAQDSITTDAGSQSMASAGDERGAVVGSEVLPEPGISSETNMATTAVVSAERPVSPRQQPPPVQRDAGDPLVVRSEPGIEAAPSVAVRRPAPPVSDRTGQMREGVARDSDTKPEVGFAVASTSTVAEAQHPITDVAAARDVRRRSSPLPAAPAGGGVEQASEAAPQPVVSAAEEQQMPPVGRIDSPAEALAIDSKPTPPASSLGSAQAFGVLTRFSQHYSTGDLSALVGLFSSDANSARGGSMALAADYARLFEATSEREFAVRDLRWRLEGDTLRGEGRFEARYYRKGRLFRQVVKGEISFVMVAEGGNTRILRLDSRPDGGGA